jgi:nitrate reductase gamma subunit
MLFMKALFEHNRKLWYRSFPFHFGLYLLIGTCGLLLAAALLGLFFPAWMAGAPALALHWAYTVTGIAGVALALVGAFLLVVRRLSDPALAVSTTAGDIFNLLFFIAAFGLLSAGILLRPDGSPGVVAILQGLLTFDTGLRVPPLTVAGLCLCALLAAYIPMTHMSHFVGKYFTYHAVRWNDSPNLQGGAIERRLAEYLTYRPTWAAPHVTADGKRSWADVATTNPWEGGKK